MLHIIIATLALSTTQLINNFGRGFQIERKWLSNFIHTQAN